MALVKCSECGREVSDRAAACPHCGNPLPGQSEADLTIEQVRHGDAAPSDAEKKSSTSTLTSVVTVVLIMLAVSLFWYALGYESRHGLKSPSPSTSVDVNVDLTAVIRFTGTQFVITNNDAFSWSNCKLEVNSGIVRGGYNLSAPLIATQSTYAVGAMEFAKSSGERFNPLTMKPNNLYIECDTPRGRASYMGGWK